MSILLFIRVVPLADKGEANPCPGSIVLMEPGANLPALPEPPSPLGDLVVRNGRGNYNVPGEAEPDDDFK